MAARGLGVVLCIAALGVAGCAAPRLPDPTTAEGFRHQVEIKDDPMEANVDVRVHRWIDVRDKVRLHSARLVLSGAVPRAKPDSRNAIVVLRMDHSASSWAFPSSATYLDADGRAVDAGHVIRSQGDVVCRSGACSYTEVASFIIAPEVMRAILAARDVPGAAPGWRVRFQTRIGPIDGTIPWAMLEAFANTLDEQVSQAKKALGKPKLQGTQAWRSTVELASLLSGHNITIDSPR